MKKEEVGKFNYSPLTLKKLVRKIGSRPTTFYKNKLKHSKKRYCRIPENEEDLD